MMKRLLIDTNLLLVMIVGAIDEGAYISRSKRLNQFCVEDYHLLWAIAGEYQEVWITPYIAAEVSNLIDLDGDVGIRAFQIARELFRIFKQVQSVVSDDSNELFFLKFGLTDSSIIKLSKQFHILTNDHRMLVPLYSTSPENILPYIPYSTLNG